MDGITFDVAACLLHYGYRNTVIPLVKRAKLDVNYITAPADIVNHRLEAYEKSTSELIDTYLAILFYSIFFFGWLFLHRTKWRNRYAQSMETFLEKRGLRKLAKSFAMGPGGIAQGYGFLNEVSAYHAIRWFRPSLFVTPLVSRFGLGVATIEQGYETLFKKFLSNLNYQERKVQMARPSLGQVELTMEDGARLLFDEVILACPLDQIQFPYSYLFKEDALEVSYLFSYLFTSPSPPPFEDRAYITEYIEKKIKNKALVIRTGGQTTTGDYLYWAVGYKTPDVDEAQLKQLIETQLQKECHLKIRRVHFYRSFRYNLRFSKTALAKGIPHQLEQLQGYKNIWYSGGLLSHWDISSIYEHNRRLVNKIYYTSNRKTLFSYLNYQYRAFRSWLRLI